MAAPSCRPTSRKHLNQIEDSERLSQSKQQAQQNVRNKQWKGDGKEALMGPPALQPECLKQICWDRLQSRQQDQGDERGCLPDVCCDGDHPSQ